MGTYSADYLSFAKKRKEKSRAVTFPPIKSASSSSLPQCTFFERHFRMDGQNPETSAGEEAEPLRLLKTQISLEDTSSQAFLCVGGKEKPAHNASRIFQSVTALGDEEDEVTGLGKTSFGKMSSPTEDLSESQTCFLKGSTVDSINSRNMAEETVSTGAVADGEHLSNESRIKDIIGGNVTVRCFVKRKRFMVYVCGGYRDTVVERTALSENVYPALYLYCRQRGYDFRMADLRLGLEDGLTDRNDTAELHLETVRDCQVTPGPNFFLFTGQRHEEQTLPAHIAREDFEAILSAVEKEKLSVCIRRPTVDNGLGLNPLSLSDTSSFGSGSAPGPSHGSMSRNSDEDEEDEARVSQVGARCWADLDQDLRLLQMCYRLDENCVPAVYSLLPVSTYYPDFLSKDGPRRQQARKAWQGTCLRLWGALQRSGLAVLGEEGTSRLLRTVLDVEVEQGLKTSGPPEAQCFWYKRTITDMKYNLKTEKASDYIDLLKGRSEINPVLHSSHQKFISSVHKKLRHTNIQECSVGWGRSGLNPEQNRSHLYYTERICSDLQRTVLGYLNRVIKVNSLKGSPDVKRKEASRVQIQEEILRHVLHGQSLEKCCVFREGLLTDMQRVVESSCQRSFLLLGETGSGKSTVMARAAHLASSWISGDARVLVRFVGLTGESRNVRFLLQSLCFQLAAVYSDTIYLSEGLPELVNEFFSLLELVRADRPLVIVLDGLDELSEEHASDLSWLLPPLPPHVHLILSASAGSRCAKTLQNLRHPTVVFLPPLSPRDVSEVLKEHLERDGRKLQEWQWPLLLQACLSCPWPLYLKVAYTQSRLWSSFTPPSSVSLPAELPQLYNWVLSRLARDHGVELVRRATSLLCLSRNGITQEELLGLLAQDGLVVKELKLSSGPCAPPRVPQVLWARLRRDLGEHLVEVETDGTFVYRWAHSALALACMHKYLGTVEARTSVHADYANYFLGTGSAKQDDKDHRTFQPLAWTLEKGSVKSYVFNIRKLHGLPYHLIRSGQIVRLLSECLFNYEFLLHKARGLSVLHVEEDLKAAVVPDKELIDLSVLSQTLQLSRSVLLRDPCQLSSQLVGRLHQILADDQPVAPGDPRKYSHLHTLLAQCARSSLPVLVPSSTCLLPPGGLPHNLLAGHMDKVTALAGGRGGLVAATCSRDGTLKMWDLELGRAVRTLRVGDGVVDSITLCMGDTVVALTMRQALQVWSLTSGKLIYCESDSLDIPVVTVTLEGQLLVAFYDGSRLVKVLDLAASCRELCRVNLTMEHDPIHKDCSILVSQNYVKDYTLFAYRSGREAAVLGARKGQVLSTLTVHHAVASIQGVEMSCEYFLLFCRFPYKKRGEIIQIEIFSIQTFAYLRSVLGCGHDPISTLAVPRAGTHVVAFCPSPDTATTGIITWNLETEDHKHVSRCPGLVTGGICFDLRFCLGICSNERYLRVWNLSTKINDQTLNYNVHKVRSYGTEEVIHTNKYPRYVMCRSSKPGTVQVWNIVRSRCRGKPVRVEHGLYDHSDVALARDMKLYILTDRGTATFTDRPMPIFQTLLIYDLLRGSYVKRQSGLYIVPCPRQDYRLLEEERLLGLSETRDHLIIWDLDSGFIKSRIQVSHKVSVLPRWTMNEKCSQELLSREALVMPWDRRTESHSAKQRRLEREEQRGKVEQRELEMEKHNPVERYLLSGDEQVVVCSYFAHHLNVFSVTSQEHLHTLEDRASMLFLHTAALTHSGSHLVLSNYNDKERVSYVTLWDLKSGKVRKRLKNEPDVCCVALTDDTSRIAFGVMRVNKLKVWDPFKKIHKTNSGYDGLTLGVTSQLFVIEAGARAILLAGEVSLWDLEASTVLSVFTPDSRIQCLSLHAGGRTLLLGMSDRPALVTLKLTSQEIRRRTWAGVDLFGEQLSSSEEEEEVEEEDRACSAPTGGGTSTVPQTGAACLKAETLKGGVNYDKP